MFKVGDKVKIIKNQENISYFEDQEVPVDKVYTVSATNHNECIGLVEHDNGRVNHCYSRFELAAQSGFSTGDITMKKFKIGHWTFFIKQAGDPTILRTRDGETMEFNNEDEKWADSDTSIDGDLVNATLEETLWARMCLRDRKLYKKSEVVIEGMKKFQIGVGDDWFVNAPEATIFHIFADGAVTLNADDWNYGEDDFDSGWAINLKAVTPEEKIWLSACLFDKVLYKRSDVLTDFSNKVGFSNNSVSYWVDQLIDYYNKA